MRSNIAVWSFIVTAGWALLGATSVEATCWFPVRAAISNNSRISAGNLKWGKYAEYCYDKEEDIIAFALAEICQPIADKLVSDAIAEGATPEQIASDDEIVDVATGMLEYSDCSCENSPEGTITHIGNRDYPLPRSMEFSACSTNGRYHEHRFGLRRRGGTCSVVRNPYFRATSNDPAGKLPKYWLNVHSISPLVENIPANVNLCPVLQDEPSVILSSLAQLTTQELCEGNGKTNPWMISSIMAPAERLTSDVTGYASSASGTHYRNELDLVVTQPRWDSKSNRCVTYDDGSFTETDGRKPREWVTKNVLGLGSSPARSGVPTSGGYRYPEAVKFRHSDIFRISPSSCKLQSCRCLIDAGGPCSEQDLVCPVVEEETAQHAQYDDPEFPTSTGPFALESNGGGNDFDQPPPRIPFPYYWLVNQFDVDKQRKVFTRKGTSLLDWGFVSVEDLTAKVPDLSFDSAEELEALLESSPATSVGTESGSISCGMRGPFWIKRGTVAIPGQTIDVIEKMEFVGEDGDDSEIKRAVAEFFVVTNRLRYGALARLETLAVRDLLLDREILGTSDPDTRERLGPPTYRARNRWRGTGDTFAVDDPIKGSENILTDPRFPKTKIWVDELKAKLQGKSSESMMVVLIKQTIGAIWSIWLINQEIAALSDRVFVPREVLGPNPPHVSQVRFFGSMFPHSPHIRHTSGTNGEGAWTRAERARFFEEFQPQIQNEYQRLRGAIDLIVAANSWVAHPNMNADWFTFDCENKAHPEVCLPSLFEIRAVLVSILEQDREQLLADLADIRKASAFVASGRDGSKWLHPSKNVVEDVTIDHKEFYEIVSRMAPFPTLARLPYEPNATNRHKTLAAKAVRANGHLALAQTVIDFRSGVLDAAIDAWHNFTVGAGLTVASLGIGGAAGSIRAAIGMLRTGNTAVRTMALAGLAVMGAGHALDTRDIIDACGDMTGWDKPLAGNTLLDKQGRLNLLSELHVPELNDLLGNENGDGGTLKLGAHAVEDYRGCVMTLALSLGLNGLPALTLVPQAIRGFLERKVKNNPQNRALLRGMIDQQVYASIRRNQGLPEPSFSDIENALKSWGMRFEDTVLPDGRLVIELIPETFDDDLSVLIEDIIGGFPINDLGAGIGGFPGGVFIDPKAKISHVDPNQPTDIILSGRDVIQLKNDDLFVFGLITHEGVHIQFNRQLFSKDSTLASGHVSLREDIPGSILPKGYNQFASASEMTASIMDMTNTLGKIRKWWQYLRNAEFPHSATSPINRTQQVQLLQDELAIKEIRNIMEELADVDKNRREFAEGFLVQSSYAQDAIFEWRDRDWNLLVDQEDILYSFRIAPVDIDSTASSLIFLFPGITNGDFAFEVQMSIAAVRQRQYIQVQLDITDLADLDFPDEIIDELKDLSQTEIDGFKELIGDAYTGIPDDLPDETIRNAVIGVPINDPDLVTMVKQVFQDNPRPDSDLISQSLHEGIRNRVIETVLPVFKALREESRLHIQSRVSEKIIQVLAILPRSLQAPLSMAERQLILQEFKQLAQEIRSLTELTPAFMRDYIDRWSWAGENQKFFDELLQPDLLP